MAKMKKPTKSETVTLPDIMFTSTASSLPTHVYIHTGTSMVMTHSKVTSDSFKVGAANIANIDQNGMEENVPKTKANDGIPNIENNDVKNHQETENTVNEVEVKDVQKDKPKVQGNSRKSRDKKQLFGRTSEIQSSPHVKDSLKLPELQHNCRSPSLAGTPNMSTRKSPLTSSPRLSEDTDAGKYLYTQVVQNARKPRAQDKSHIFPDIKIKYLDKRENTKDMMKNQEMIPIPFSHIDRKVTVVRNAMYGNFLRKSTKKLQDDLRQTMRVYSSEKHELLRQLASLRHEMDELKASDTSSSPTSFSSDSSSIKSTPRYFQAPNLAANKVGKKRRRKNSVTSEESMGSQNQKIKEGILRLPTIKDASPAPQEWESGNSMHTNLPPIVPPKGLVAAKALMDNNFSIPKISDPSREDISVSSLRQQSIREKKKVHFSEENKITEFEVIQYNENEAKNWRRGGADSPTDNYRKPRTSKKGKSERGGSRVTLAPLKRPNDPKEAQKVAAEYKSLYLSIHDPEERTKTLADILYAVRMRMQENEQNLKFGESPRPSKTNNTLCDFLLSNSSEDPLLKGEPSKTGNKFLGAPNHTAARIGRRSHAIQLQNYLRKMSKSRRMIEHMEAEQYRLAHIIGHKHLMAASQAAQT